MKAFLNHDSPWLWIDLFEFDLMRSDWSTVFVKDQEPRAGSALVNRANKFF